jgi:stage V sporulation protein D (sporulation-specific penicillin-binding protein)
MKLKTKRITEKRLVAVLLIFTLSATFLLINIFRLCYLNYDYYRDKTYNQITTSSPLRAERGKIYDSNMNILAKSDTVWRIFVSTRDIKKAEKADGVDYCRVIANGIAPILSLNEDSIYDKIKKSKVLDVTIKKAATEDEYKAVLDLISDKSLDGLIYTEAETSRSYPEGRLAAHVLGFTGSDNQGLYGLEYYYDDILSGTDGYYLYAKDAGGRELDTEYTDYIPAEDGYSIVTTIDSYIQSELESIIETIRINHGVENRVCGIVMDTSTGAILAMATTTPFNPNLPFVLDEVYEAKLKASGFVEGSDEYKAYKNELLQIMWSNKPISETYEPGSTFKIVTVSAGLDLGVVSPNDTFSCNGYKQIGGYRIRCHKVKGHGSGFSLAYGLQMSCNPCMMSVSERIGAENFYSYVERFGYFEKSGIDLPGEGTTIFHQKENIGSTELATASFGQRFKVSVINQLVAISAIANGGKLVTPYIVDKVLDSEGNLISQHQTQIKRQVVSEEVADTVAKILIDGVNGDGGAKNAGVVGYDIAAKTGTSQKFDILDENGNSYLRIGSTVAFALDENAGISMIIVVDEPTCQVKYGSVVAAPYVSELYEKILPYMEFKSSAESTNITISNYVGKTTEEATKELNELKIAYEIVGSGKTIIKQTPSAGDVVTYPVSKILLYTEDIDETVRVPNVVGQTLADAIVALTNAGLNVKISGSGASATRSLDIVTSQSLTYGMIVNRGEIIIIRAVKEDFED